MNSKRNILVKIGGSVAESQNSLSELVSELCYLIAKEGFSIILVHGGGAEISRNLALVNKTPQWVDGLRVTSPQDMKMVEMTLSGYVNKMLVSLFEKLGKNEGIVAVGISGVDARTFVCKPLSRELGQVGKIVEVNTRLVNALQANGMVPVVSPVSTDANGDHYNVNADEAARAMAMALKVDKLIFVSDVQGVLNNDKERIPLLNPESVNDLIASGVVKGGMIPKLKACLEVAASGVQEVHICGWSSGAAFRQQLLSTRNSGTIVHS